MELPTDLLCLFTAEIRGEDGTHRIDVPERELEQGELAQAESYRVALLPTRDGADSGATRFADEQARPDPPVAEGDRRIVHIENIGDQGDGIARVERGYVVIVPDTQVGDEVAVEIEDIHPNFAMGSVIEAGDSA